MADAGRVIAGLARGRRLRSPGGGTRPLGDRVKQSLFASLEPVLPGIRVLDLFAGSGAGGIEALSRGAAHCDFVERDAGAVRVIDENLRETGLAGSGAVRRADVLAFLSGSTDLYGLVLVDPPYGDPVMLAVLERLGSTNGLLPGATVVAKHFWRDRLPERAGRLVRVGERRFGETALTIYHADGGAEP
jgi:16S rRNA (guanine966-N2)-methyltransferase